MGSTLCGLLESLYRVHCLLAYHAVVLTVAHVCSYMYTWLSYGWMLRPVFTAFVPLTLNACLFGAVNFSKPSKTKARGAKPTRGSPALFHLPLQSRALDFPSTRQSAGLAQAVIV